MTDGKKRYYWIKLKENFFDTPAIDYLQELENGCEYIVLYQKLCLLAANTDGQLVRQIGEISIPYDAKKISEVTRFKFDTVVVALGLFQKLGLTELREDGILIIPGLGEMVGSETKMALYQRGRREKIKAASSVPLFPSREDDTPRSLQPANNPVDKKFTMSTSENLQCKPNVNENTAENGLQKVYIVNQMSDKRLEIRDKEIRDKTIESVCENKVSNNNKNNNIYNTTRTHAHEENDESVFDFSNSSQEKPPSLEEVKKFAEEMNYTHTDPAAFWQHYEFSNWRDQGGRLINWRQKLFKWERDDAERKVRNGAGNKPRMAARMDEKERQLNAAEQRLLEQWGDD